MLISKGYRGPRLPLATRTHRPANAAFCRPRIPALLGPDFIGYFRVLLRVFGILQSPATTHITPFVDTVGLPKPTVISRTTYSSAPCTLTASHADASPEHRVGRNLPRDKHGAVSTDKDAVGQERVYPLRTF